LQDDFHTRIENQRRRLKYRAVDFALL
jgi:hypothetical protein